MTEDQEIAQSIEKNGWHAIAVDDGEVSFVYTCGLQFTFDHPDLVIFGLVSKTAYAILSQMIGEIKNGRTFEYDVLYSDILSFPIFLRGVHETQHEVYFGYAMGHRRMIGQAGTLIVRQVFWPDKDGCFSFELGCDPRVCQMQPRLDLIALNEDREN